MPWARASELSAMGSLLVVIFYDIKNNAGKSWICATSSTLETIIIISQNKLFRNVVKENSFMVIFSSDLNSPFQLCHYRLFRKVCSKERWPKATQYIFAYKIPRSVVCEKCFRIAWLIYNLFTSLDSW